MGRYRVVGESGDLPGRERSLDGAYDGEALKLDDVVFFAVLV